MEEIKNKETTGKRKSENHGFKTTEVIVLVLLTCVISLAMGFFLNSRFANGNTKYANLINGDQQLQTFIATYNDVINNYYEEVDREKVISNAIDGMFSSLDTNSNYLNEEVYDSFNKQLDGEYRGIGIEVINTNDGDILIRRVFENTPAKVAGLKALDIIKSVDGKFLKGKDTSELVKLISNNHSEYIEIVVVREKKEITLKIKQDKVVLKSVSSEVIEKNQKQIGYIDINIFANNTSKQFLDELKKLEKDNIDSLIIDVRDNSGGHLKSVVDILSQLLSKEHVIYQVEVKGKTTKYYSEGNETKKYPIIVLINQASASASEVLASALEEQINATLIGEKSFGKGTIQELQELKSGDSYKITTKKWLTSKGNWIHEKGLTPTIQVSLTEEYYNNPEIETDGQLQKALEQLSN